MSSVIIKTAGPLTTVQDAGRPKYQQFGVPVSGVMDAYSFRAANLLVGNPENTGVLECTLMGPAMEFMGDAVIAVTGADAPVKLNHTPVSMWRTLHVKSGDVISIGAAVSGSRIYIAFAGGLDIPFVMSSQSTYLRAAVGGLDGRKLQAGDEIGLNPGGTDLSKIPARRAGNRFVPRYEKEFTLHVVLGPQDDYFTSNGIRTFLETPYTVSNASDRMGYRFDGAVIEHKKAPDLISDGIAMGAVQVPGSGLPIVLMADRQTTGGYTKIANVTTCDLPLLGQARPGDVAHFKKSSIQEAQAERRRFEENMRLFRRCMHIL